MSERDHDCNHVFPAITINLTFQFMDGADAAEWYYGNIKASLETAMSAADRSVDAAGHDAVTGSGEGMMKLEVISADGKILELVKEDEWHI